MRNERQRECLIYGSNLGLGGVATAFRALAAFLEHSGWRVKVFVPYEEDIQKAAIPNRYIVGAARKRPIRNRIIKRIVNLFNLITNYRFFFLGVPRFSHDVFVVYSVWGNAHWVRYSDKCRIGWLHVISSEPRPGMRGRIWYAVERKCLIGFNKLIAVSQEVAHDWDVRFRLWEKPAFVPNLIEFDLGGGIGDGECRHRKRLLFVGRMDGNKGCMRLLKVLVNLRSIIGDSDLWIVGDGPERTICERYVQDVGMGDVVKFLGARSSCFAIMRQAGLLVVPSYVEGFGLVAIEALLNRLPVLATDSIGIRSALRNGEWGRIVENNELSLQRGLQEWIGGRSFDPKCGYEAVKDMLIEENERAKESLLKIFTGN